MENDKEQVCNRNTLGSLYKQNRSAYRQYRFNRSFVSEFDYRNRYMKRLIHAKGFFKIKQPFYCIYGDHIYIGRAFRCGHSAYFEDDAKITIMDHVNIGNHVKLLTVQANYQKDKKQCDKALPITIEDHVFIGNDVTIMPGVTIHKGSIISDGCIIDKDIQPNSYVVCKKEQLCYLHLKDEDQPKSKYEGLMDHVNLDKTDALIRAVMIAGSSYCVYKAARLMIDKKAVWEEKKNRYQKAIPLLEGYGHKRKGCDRSKCSFAKKRK